MKKDDNQKISDLQKVIDLGKKLKKDTKPDEAKLKILQDKQKDNSKAIVKKEPEKKLNIPTKKTQEVKDNSNIDTENLIKRLNLLPASLPHNPDLHRKSGSSPAEYPDSTAYSPGAALPGTVFSSLRLPPGRAGGSSLREIRLFL